MKVAVLILALFVSVMLVPADHAGEPPHIIVDAGAPVGVISPLLFGHNIQWWENGTFMWDPTTRRVKSEVLPILHEVCRYPATVRFPGGFWGDVIHWRRAVGPPEKRPMEMFYGRKIEQNFGTDELMLFLRQVSPGMSPLMIVNWWDWNRPERLEKGSPLYIEGSREKGMWEAANWVEYCNGVVTPELLERAVKEGWQPSRFVDPKDPTRESREPDAIESADGIHSWRSFEKAPKGYFAWLRRYFAWRRASGPLDENVETWTDLKKFPEESYGGPYGVEYWEIGNEIYFRDKSAYDIYRKTLIEWSEAMKKANDVDGKIIQSDFSVEEGDSFGRRELGAYSGKKLRIGACAMGVQQSISEWDRKVLTPETARYIEWIAVHPYASVFPDERYAGILAKPSDRMISRLPIHLKKGEAYNFRIRAKAVPVTPGTDTSRDYPTIRVELVPDRGASIVTLKTNDKRRVENTNEVYVRFPLDADKDGQQFTDYDTDYIYTATVPADGDYFVSITASQVPRTKDESACVWISLVSYASNKDESESLIAFASEEDQVKAYYWIPKRLGAGLGALRSYAIKISPKKTLAIGCTEYRAMFGWSGADAHNSMKGTIVTAELIRQFIEHRVILANFWTLFNEIAEPWHLGYSPIRKQYLDLRGKWVVSPKVDGFMRTGTQQLFKLLGEHFGEHLLETNVPRTDEESEHCHLARRFGDVQPILEPDKIPYLSAVASASGWHDGRFAKIFVLVINKDWSKERLWTVQFQRINSPPRIIRYHTLKNWDADNGIDTLDATNTFISPERISIRTETGAASDFDIETSTIRHTFPPSSITVIELMM